MISWREGQDVCESHGGYLAEVKTEDQQTFLVGEIFYENFNLNKKLSRRVLHCSRRSLLAADLGSLGSRTLVMREGIRSTILSVGQSDKFDQ